MRGLGRGTRARVTRRVIIGIRAVFLWVVIKNKCVGSLMLVCYDCAVI